MKAPRKFFSVALILLAVLAVVFLLLALWMEFFAVTWPRSLQEIDYPIDRLDIYSVAEGGVSASDYMNGTAPKYSEPVFLRSIDDPAKIRKYSQKHRWADSYASPEPPETRYIIYEYYRGQRVGVSYYGGIFARYNNLSFTLWQLRLIKEK